MELLFPVAVKVKNPRVGVHVTKGGEKITPSDPKLPGRLRDKSKYLPKGGRAKTKRGQTGKER